MPTSKIGLNAGKAIYFASDFHLGAPNLATSHQRERKIIDWLNHIAPDAEAIFLLGDIFDFWFEYKLVVPRGHVRLLGKLAELSDKGIKIITFAGNHDMWREGYFEKEMGVEVFMQPTSFTLGNKMFHVGHGDGLGHGDFLYKILKHGLFKNKLLHFLFKQLHPGIGVGLGLLWAKLSRERKKGELPEQPNGEYIAKYCEQVEAKQHHDFYLFGHRHIVLDIAIGQNARYLNPGEWITQSNYLRFDGENIELKQF